MVPALTPGTIVIGFKWARKYRPGQMIIFLHEGKEKVKRIDRVEENGELFVLGELLDASTDSRHFGKISPLAVVAKIIWPKPSRKFGSYHRTPNS